MFAVIMAGGKGTRFWPRSREKMPKHLLDIQSEKSMIRETVDRIRPLVPPERTLIVTGRSHAAELIRQLPEIPAENILIEPVGRNTAPCIGLAALHVRKRAGDAIMLVLSSDHRIVDEAQFLRVLETAAGSAEADGTLVTIGITPTGPATGYGYIEQGESVTTDGGLSVCRVKGIREKPDAKTACDFLARGGFVWNSGMFVWKASTILSEIARHLPEIYQGLMEIDKVVGTEAEDAVVGKVYPSLPSVSIDYGVMEKAGDVLVIPGDFGWSDLGSWDALWEESPKDENGNVIRGRFVGVDSGNSLVYSPDKLVAVVGVEDILVVDTKDALLICRRNRSQDVRKIVEILDAKGTRDCL